MANIVCQVIARDDSITLIWAEGGGAFDPYKIEGQALLNLRAAAKAARACLSDMVKDYLNGTDEDVRKSSFELARAGAKLHGLIFRPDSGTSGRVGKLVRKWLDDMYAQGAVDTLEIVIDGASSIPWNILYAREPDQAAFLSADDTAHWGEFWGIKFNLAANRRVEPLRRLPLIRDPKVLLVIDPAIRDGLPDDQKARLQALVAKHGMPVVESKSSLVEVLRQGRPDLIYWLCHADPTALILGDEPIGPNDLLDMLRGDDDEDRLGGIAFLNACQTAESSADGCFLDALQEVGLSGIIATEQQTVDTFANPLGIDFLEAFLERGEAIGTLMQGLRARVPLGLLYGSYCPPNIRVAGRSAGKESPASLAITTSPRVVGMALGISSAEVSSTAPPLPDAPYRSLAFYERPDRALFGGRDADIRRFARILDDTSTRVLILHGESGVGKSSFLRAGVIPYLEEECIGYRFFRSRTVQGQRSPILFIRATHDLPGQLAAALAEFCARPLTYQTPLGESVEVDLPGLLAKYVGGGTEPAALRAAMGADPSLLGRLLTDIADSLPFAPVLLVDQGEEVFTLESGPDASAVRNESLELLRRAAGTAGDFKVIVSLRTEYYGRLVDRIRRGGRDLGGVREYLLTDFEEADVIEAIRRPTLEHAIPHAAEIPFEKYGFRFADGVPERIARAVMTVGTGRRDSPLPLVQVICVQLYELARRRPDTTVTDADFALIGGVAGGLRRHVETQLAEILKGNASDIRRMKSLFVRLYLTQPDGTLTTALVPEADLAKDWSGSIPFATVLAAGVDRQLLRTNSLRIGEIEERRYVSLGHDALAKVAATWERELRQRRRVRSFRIALCSAMAAIVLMGLFVVHFAREARREARRGWINLYKVQINAASQAWTSGEMTRLRPLLLSVVPRRGEEDLRGFEWSYLWRLAQPRELPDPILPPDLRCIAGTRDGTRLVIGSADGQVELWNATTSQFIDRYTASTESIDCIAISPDGKLVATGGPGSTISVWEVDHKRFRHPIRGHSERVASLTVSNDGRWLASGDREGEVRIWNLATGSLRMKNRDRNLKGWVLALVFSHDDKKIVYGFDNFVHILNLADGTKKLLHAHQSVVSALAFANEGKALASGHRNGDVIFWNADHKGQHKTLSGHKGQITSLSFARGDMMLASGSVDSTVKIWNAPRGQLFGTLRGHTGSFVGTAFVTEEGKPPVFDPEKDTAKILTISDGPSDRANGQMRIWTLPDSQSAITLRGHKAQVWDVAYHNETATIISASHDRSIRFWHVVDGRESMPPIECAAPVASVAVSPDGQTLAAGLRGGLIKFWHLDGKLLGEPFASIRTGQGALWRVRFLGDNEHVVSSGIEGSVMLWNLSSGDRQTPKILAKHPGAVVASGLATWNDRVALCGDVGVISLWDAQQGRRRLTRDDDYRTSLNGVAFSPDGKTVATGDARGNIILWDFATGNLIDTIPAHIGMVETLAYTSDGRRLASGGTDKSIKIWDTKTNRFLLNMEGHTDALTSLAFIRGDKVLVSGSEDGTIKLWRAASDEDMKNVDAVR
jgi:WD40 repeat protein